MIFSNCSNLLVINSSKCIKINLITRYKHKDSHWAVVRKKKTNTDRAMEHFDEFYRPVFKKDWNGIKQGLLGKQKYVAVVNNFSDSERICDELECSGATNLRRLFDLEKEYLSKDKRKFNKKTREIFKETVGENTKLVNHKIDSESKSVVNNDDVNLSDFIPATEIKGREDFITESEHYSYYNGSEGAVVDIERQYDIHFSKNLNVYLYDTEGDERFKPPGKGSTGVYDYYLLDGGSVLPVLALDVRPDDAVLDMCSAPGGKSLLTLQTLYPRKLICNDVSKSRVERVRNVMRQYLYDYETNWIDKLRIQQADGREIGDGEFDKVLVDVPCTTDRHSVNVQENNIFKTDRVKERLKLPELQCDLLVQALKLVKVDGCVVYSTCTLNPIQNDGVVHMALKRIRDETNLEFKVVNLFPALLQALTTYKMAAPILLKYGHLVLPNIKKNFGPTYFCKLQRIVKI